MSLENDKKNNELLDETAGIRPNIPPTLLSSLHSPRELREFSQEQLERLALEIRTVLCNLSEKRSVHFASNLGVVELTIALHTEFDFMRDRLVWDVGHQCYPHKLLTGRFEQFETMRVRGGLSGYPNPAESDYDLFQTGHAGCSIGTALGLACGDEIVRRLNENNVTASNEKNEPRYSVAVVGDGSFSSGPIFEALNHAGGLQQKMLVILNDNKMSICNRVGALGLYLDKFRTGPYYHGVKSRVRRMLEDVPTAYSFLSRLKEAIKTYWLGGALFEDFGFQYMGPIDGHDVTMLRKYFEAFKSSSKPVLLHVLTEKGRGFIPAENDPSNFHSTSPAKILKVERSASLSSLNSSSNSKTKKGDRNVRRMASIVGAARIQDESDESGSSRLTAETENPRQDEKCAFTYWAQAAIYKAMCDDPRVCVIVAAMTQGNMLERVRAEFPDRFYDVGICEAHGVNLAAGLAKSGLKPIVVIYSGFLQRAYDHLFQEVALQDLPIVFALDRAGLVGADGATHHGVFDISYLRPFPNLCVLAPGDGGDVAGAFEFALTNPHPTAIRYPKVATGILKRELTPYKLGKAEILRQGNDGAIVVCGGGVLEGAWQFVEQLATKGGVDGGTLRRFDLSIINARFVKPLDSDVILQPLREGKPLITLEENMLAGGFGSAVLEAANDEGLDVRTLVRLGVPDRFIGHGTREEELNDVGLDFNGMMNAFLKARERALHLNS